ncbi:phage late control D family protein [Amycolatopsis samaneae]|uniref:Phage late control D family protein n=1 Tax=Amycolatopsis samaneae TaxID=664691 RepID=A0ABW5GEE5_9PSEU
MSTPTTAAQPIARGQDFYVPAFEIRPPGRPLPKDVLHDVISVNYSDDLTQIDKFEIVVNNWDARTRTFKYSNGNTFLPGQKLELWMGYRGKDPLRRVATGEITSLRPSFPAAGQPTLTVSALNVLHRFRTKQVTEKYENKTDSQIAKLIGKRLGVKVHTQPLAEQAYPYLVQDNQYDIVFLFERAHRIGYDLWVEEDQSGEPTLHFEPSDNLRKVTYELVWGRSLVEFQPTLTTARQVGSVTVRAWDRRRKKMITATAKRKSLGSKDDEGVSQAFNEREDITSVVVADQAEADRIARDRLRDIAHEMIKASGSTVGLPDLRAGRMIRVGGLGTRFDGGYFLTGTRHSFSDAGYVTSFDCRKEG